MKGICPMNYPKDILCFVRKLVNEYSTYSPFNKNYSLDLDALPNSVRYEFAVKMMSFDPSFASEATGPDNQYYDKEMIPALCRYLMKPTEKDEEIEFLNSWKKSVSDYFNNYLQEIIDSMCQEKCNEEINQMNVYKKYYRNNGEPYWIYWGQ
jgi:hypothetical protein